MTTLNGVHRSIHESESQVGVSNTLISSDQYFDKVHPYDNACFSGIKVGNQCNPKHSTETLICVELTD